MRTRLRPGSALALGALTGTLLLGGMAGVASAQGLTVAPGTVGNDGTKTFTLTGTKFLPANQEAVELRPNPAIAGQGNLAGTVLDNSSDCGLGLPDSDCGTTLRVTVDTTNVAPGTYDVVETQSPLLGGGSVSTASKAVTVFAQPRFAATAPIAPSVRGQGSTSTVTVTGTGFSTGMAVGFGAGTTTSALTIVSPTKLTVTLAVAPDAATGARDVTLTPPPGGGSPVAQTGGLTVTQAPQVDSISPTSLKVGESKQGAVITGARFAAGSDLGVAIAGVTVTNPVVSADGTTITADLAVSPTARGGQRTLFVSNGDGGTASKAGAFTVLSAPSAPAAVAAYPGDTKVGVAWQAPTDPGTSPVSGYTVTASDPNVAPVTASASARFAVVPGLTNGVSYTFKVVATNAVGTGPAATTGAVTPKFATTLTWHLSANRPVSGSTVTLSGKLLRTTGSVPLAGSTVTLRFAPQVGSASFRNVTTAADGSWSYTFTPTYTFGLSATYAGTAVNAARVLSTTVQVPTKVVITSPSSGATTSAATTVVVTGTTSPNKAGRTIGLYTIVNGYPSLFAKAVVASNGSYRIGVKLPRGTWTTQVRIGTTNGNAPGASPYLVLRRV